MPCTNSAGGTTKPPSPWTGSKTIAATCSAATLVENASLDPAKGGLGVGASIRVGERHAVDLGRERAQARLVRVGLRRQRHRHQRPSVERSVERDHGRTARRRPRDLDGVLDRLGARVEERDPNVATDRREGAEALGELDVHLVGQHREVGVDEAGGLLLDRLNDPGSGMSDVEAAHAAREVDEDVAVHVGHERAGGLRDHDRQVDRERIGDDAALALEDLLRARARNRRPEHDRASPSHPDPRVVDDVVVVLSDRTIRRLVAEERIGIDPYDDDLVQPSSVDVRVDRFFRVFRNAHHPYIDVKQPMEGLTELVEIGGEEPFILHPGEFVLGSTLERVTLPDDLVARLEGKSSLGRLGLLIHSTAGFIDPGWDGHVTLELSNVANLPITIYVGMKIGQLSFVQMTEAAESPYGSASLGSKYKGQTGPTPSRYWQNFQGSR